MGRGDPLRRWGGTASEAEGEKTATRCDVQSRTVPEMSEGSRKGSEVTRRTVKGQSEG